MNNWISVKDRLPTHHPKECGGTPVWVYVDEGRLKYQSQAVYTLHGKFIVFNSSWGQGDKTDFITHWMPLPEPPKEV